MKFLIDEGYVENDPESVAKFLRHTEGLDKTKVGEYLGEGYDYFCRKLRKYAISAYPHFCYFQS